VVRADRDTLAHYEELALARYASGVGTDQGVIKIQAEITRDDHRLLDIATRRATLVAALNALRDAPPGTPVPELGQAAYPAVELSLDELRARARAQRPELARAEAELTGADHAIELARREYKPDLTLGAVYTMVGKRSDPAGIAMPPPDDGSDVFGISLSVNLPVHRGRLAAGVEQAAQQRLAAAERQRTVLNEIDRALAELVARVRLTWDQLRLFETLLGVQAEESLRSAESGYAAGTLGALDLLDAERVLLDVKVSTERTRADYAIAIARLEGAVGEPISAPALEGGAR
jgi:outer membrane protein TolC